MMIERCKKATEINRSGRYRKGNVIKLPEQGDVIITGDLHGHRRNFERIVKYADLDNHPDRRVVLHEILHGGPEDDQGGCLSYELFDNVLQYKIDYPDQVHLIMGNHDTAIITNSDVMKSGKEMNQALKAALQRTFHEDYGSIMTALRNCLLSQPLAVQCPNGVWFSHSLPACRFLNHFDVGIFSRELEEEDLIRPGSVYLLTWGRHHKQETLDALAELLEVRIFIAGHQPQESGWHRAGQNLIILACDHNHGCILPFELNKEYSTDELLDRIVPLASIA